MDNKELAFVLDRIKNEIGLCRTERDALDIVIGRIGSNSYMDALDDVEHILATQMCSVKNGKLLMVEDGIWVNAIESLRLDKELEE